jgi:hypothetical protein
VNEFRHSELISESSLVQKDADLSPRRISTTSGGHSDESATANRISYHAIPEDAETISHG